MRDLTCWDGAPLGAPCLLRNATSCGRGKAAGSGPGLMCGDTEGPLRVKHEAGRSTGRWPQSSRTSLGQKRGDRSRLENSLWSGRAGWWAHGPLRLGPYISTSQSAQPDAHRSPLGCSGGLLLGEPAWGARPQCTRSPGLHSTQLAPPPAPLSSLGSHYF